MCFVEFIGYTCGHMSLPVIRPCPLTTARHTFPTCPRRADKPFLAGEMCSACQKVIHSRATQIEEYEHRFMHERGVCGCKTVFPYLIRPRFIGTADPADGGAAEPADDDTTTTTPPILQEDDVDGAHVVSVRLPSLFAAEWVADHRERHEAGLCQCHIDFRTHQEAVQMLEATQGPFLEGAGQATDAADAEEQPAELHANSTEPQGHEARGREAGKGSSIALPVLVGRDPRRTVSWSPPRWPRRRTTTDDKDDDDDTSDTDQTVFHSCASVGSHCESTTVPLNTPEHHHHQHNACQAAAPTAAAAAVDRLELQVGEMNMDGACDGVGVGVGVGVRFAGSVFEEVPSYLFITGPFLRPSIYGEHPLMDAAFLVPEEPEAEPESERPQLEVIVETDVEGDTETDWSLSPVFHLGPNVAARPAKRPAAKPVLMNHSLFVPMVPPPPWQLIPPLAGLPIGAGPEGTLHTVPWEQKPLCWRGHFA